MRLLLDENLPSKLTGLFAPEVEAVTVAQQGWRGKENGELIALTRREFDALATMDRSMPHQQNLEEVDLVILLLEAPSNRLADLAPLVGEAKAALSEARPGKIVRVQG
jgi:predicted nuclease of predicted toxin-antitoxin system